MTTAERRRRPGGEARRVVAAPILLAMIVLPAGCSAGGEPLEDPAASAASATTGIADDVGSTPSPTPSVDPRPFTVDDLEGLVLTPDEGEGLVRGLSYASTYSGEADIGDVHHWTLVPTEPLEEAGFVQAYSAMFMTPAFPSTFARDGRDLATAALLFESPTAARHGLRIFEDTRAEVWEECRPLPMRNGLGTSGLLGSDNVAVVYPTVGFMGRAGNVIVLVGSQGGSERDDPLPERMVRGIALDLLARARTEMGGGR